MADMIPEQLDRLEGLLAAATPGDWIAHDGGGRPHKPGEYVEVEMRGGRTISAPSAFICWTWIELDELQGYADDPDPSDDVLRWRPTKRPPSDKELAAFVPSLIASLKAAREALEDFCLSAECAAGCDEGVSPDTASSEIMSAMGSAMSVSYDRARQSLEGNPHVG